MSVLTTKKRTKKKPTPDTATIDNRARIDFCPVPAKSIEGKETSVGYTITLNAENANSAPPRPANLVPLEDVPHDVRRHILKSARLEPSVPNGHLYAYAVDVETATRAVRGSAR